MQRYYINISPSSSSATYKVLGRWMSELSENENPLIFSWRYLGHGNFFHETLGSRSVVSFKGFLKKNDPVGSFLDSCRRKVGKEAETTMIQYDPNSAFSEKNGYSCRTCTVVPRIRKIEQKGREVMIEGEFLLSGLISSGTFIPPADG